MARAATGLGYLIRITRDHCRNRGGFDLPDVEKESNSRLGRTIDRRVGPAPPVGGFMLSRVMIRVEHIWIRSPTNLPAGLTVLLAMMGDG
jgi:hypothetical protein